MLLEMGDIITTGSCYFINDYYVQGALLNALPDFILKKKTTSQNSYEGSTNTIPSL